MRPGAVLAGVLLALAVAVLGWRPRRRVPGPRSVPSGRPRDGSGGGGRSAVGPAGPVTAPDSRARVAGLLAGLSLAVLLPFPLGPLVGAAGVAVLPSLLAGLETAAARAERQRLVAELPLALDLLAACLAGGATLARAAVAVASAVGGPVGDRLQRVSAALALGSPADEAWALLAGPAGAVGLARPAVAAARSGPGPGPPRIEVRRRLPVGTRPWNRPVDDPLAPAARALVRAARAGAPVAPTIGRLAAESRAAARSRGEVAARRAGVLAVAPLALCFLPAFVLLGVVPVVVGLLAPLLAAM